MPLRHTTSLPKAQVKRSVTATHQQQTHATRTSPIIFFRQTHVHGWDASLRQCACWCQALDADAPAARERDRLRAAGSRYLKPRPPSGVDARHAPRDARGVVRNLSSWHLCVFLCRCFCVYRTWARLVAILCRELVFVVRSPGALWGCRAVKVFAMRKAWGLCFLC